MDVVLEALLAESDVQAALGEAGITKASMEAAVTNARGTKVSGSLDGMDGRASV